mmetsp:Transcript_33219/g.105058  ORF Transcript_33219/g.105058 Transcript_33219/m.105058 type:complete len:167 (-) Transcript_33219:162-662(-)
MADVADISELQGPEAAERSDSALQANIREKGSNAYYYAHGNRDGVEKIEWDGKEEPRLLRTEAKTEEDKKAREAITTYGWYDDGAKVKIYVDREGIEDLPEDAVTIANDARSATLTIEENGIEYVLLLTPLRAAITEAKIRRKPGKVWITLKKELDSVWATLLEKD